jgi:O-antigen/teichoic acid export membrane protein
MEPEPTPSGAPPVSLAARASQAVVWNLVLVPVQAAVTLVAAALVARRLTLPEYAAYSLAMSTIAAIVLCSDLGLSATISRFTPLLRESGAPALRRFVRRASAVRLAVMAALMIAAAAAGRVPALAPVIPFAGRDLLLLLAAGALQGLSRIQEYLLGGLLDRGGIGALRVVVALAQPALVITALALDLGVRGILAALLLAAALELALFARRAASVLRRTGHEGGAAEPGLPRRTVQFAAVSFAEKTASYLGSSGFVIFLLAGLGRPAEVPYFAVAGEFAARVLAGLTIPFAGIVLPVLATLEARARPQEAARAVRLHLLVLLLVVLPSAGLLAALAEELVTLVYSAKFLPAVPILQVLVPLLFAEYVFYAALLPALLTRERYRDVLLSKVPVLVGTAAAALVIPGAGAIGAAAAYGLARVVSAVFLYVASAREFRFRFPARFAAKVLAATAVGVVVALVLRGPWAQGGAWPLALAAAGGAAFFVVYRALGGMAAEDREQLSRGTPAFERVFTYLL